MSATMTKEEIQLESLTRARSGQSWSNYSAIIQGFMDKGIPADQISPRENVFTYNAWRALNRQVRRGEHGVKVLTYIKTNSKETTEGESNDKAKRAGARPWTATVFHISQTDPIKGE